MYVWNNNLRMVGPKPIWKSGSSFNVISWEEGSSAPRHFMRVYMVYTIVLHTCPISVYQLFCHSDHTCVFQKQGGSWLTRPLTISCFCFGNCQDSHCSLAGHLQSHLAKTDLPCRRPAGNKNLDWVGCTWGSVTFVGCFQYLRNLLVAPYSICWFCLKSPIQALNYLKNSVDKSGRPVDHRAVLQRWWSPWVAAKT